jgi:hypothetical protein
MMGVDVCVATGQNCVVPVSGWFCKLCNKFYNNENAAKDAHCKTEAHFGKYKVGMRLIFFFLCYLLSLVGIKEDNKTPGAVWRSQGYLGLGRDCG